MGCLGRALLWLDGGLAVSIFFAFEAAGMLEYGMIIGGIVGLPVIVKIFKESVSEDEDEREEKEMKIRRKAEISELEERKAQLDAELAEREARMEAVEAKEEARNQAKLQRKRKIGKFLRYFGIDITGNKPREAYRCMFEDGITAEEFEQIANRIAKRIRRLSVSTKGSIVIGSVESQSGISTWTFEVDFNDYGRITGKWWIKRRENIDSGIPNRFAEMMKKEIVDRNHKEE